jgi:hypothetical protein
MKSLIWIVIICSALVFWSRHRPRLARDDASLNQTQVIEYSSPDDMLFKLKQARTGQKVQLRSVAHGGNLVDTGIACNDNEGFVKYMEHRRAEADRLTREINAEVARLRLEP